MSGRIDPLILRPNLGARWSRQFRVPVALPPGEKGPVTIQQEAARTGPGHLEICI